MRRLPLDQLPPLTLFPRPHVPGVSFQDQDQGRSVLISRKGYEVTRWPSVPIQDALAPHPEHDAHCVMYSGIQADNTWSPYLPRLTLGSFDRVQEWGICDRVVGGWLIADLDLPEHEGPWTDALREKYQDRFNRAAEQDDLFAAPTWFYTTRGGLRLGYALDQPCDIFGKGGIQDLLMGIIAVGALCGLAFDQVCKDPTRLMRLPRVARAVSRIDPATGAAQEVVLPTWTQPYFRISFGRVDFSAVDEIPETLLAYERDEMPEISEIQVAEMTTPEGQALVVAWGAGRFGVVPVVGKGGGSGAPGTIPTPAELDVLGGCADIKWLESLQGRFAKRSNPSEDLSRIARAMEDPRQVYTNPASLEGLHDGLLRLVRSVIWICRDEGRKPEPQVVWFFVYRLVCAANQLRTKDQRSDETIRDEVWNTVDYYWISEEDDARFREEREAAISAKKTLATQDWQGSVSKVLDSVLKSVTDPDVYQTFSIIDTGKGGKFVLTAAEDGLFYEGPAYEDHALVTFLRDCRNPLVEYKRLNLKSSTMDYLTTKELMDRYGRAGARLTLSRLVDKTMIGRDGLGLVIRSKAPGVRRDIEPAYDERVAKWLRLLGGAQHDKFLDWLACFFNISRPCAALIIHGDPSIGKGMLGLALKNCTESRRFAEFRQVMESFQTDMFKTPFVWADENTEGGYAGADRSLINNFKKLVTGEFNSLNLKHRDHVEIEGNWRILVTGNNVENILKFREDVNDKDIDAVVIRTLFVESESKACGEYLEKIGGRQVTESWPETTIPAHIMWLATNRQVKPGNRLLVEGTRTDWHEAKRINTVITSDVMHLLAEMLDQAEAPCARGRGDVSKTIAAKIAELDTKGIHIQREAYGQHIRPMLVISPVHLRKAFKQEAENDRSLKVPAAKAIENSLRVLSRNSKVKGSGNDAYCFKRQIPGKEEWSETRRRGIQIDLRVLIGELYKNAEHWEFPNILGQMWLDARPLGAVSDTQEPVVVPDANRPFRKVF